MMMVDVIGPKSTQLGTFSARPYCGEDFCDSCGDCLHCYADDYCPDGSHMWVVYVDHSLQEFLDQHPEAERWKSV